MIIMYIPIFQIYKITRRNCKQKEKEISSTDKGILRFLVKKISQAHVVYNHNECSG